MICLKKGFIINLKYPKKMRKTVLIIALCTLVASAMTSCASYRSTGKYGCGSTKGYIGYGATR